MRRRYTARERERLIKAVRVSGTPVKAAAEGLGVSASTAYLWMKGARATAAPTFARLVPASAEASAAIIVEVGGATIRVERGFDAELLLEVVSVLGGASA